VWASILGIIRGALSALNLWLSGRERERDRQAGRNEADLAQERKRREKAERINDALQEADDRINSGDWNR
jgi:hypothetical protein